ncbi:MAG TPA: hypothetical protein VFW53_02170 [Gallionella sp.]|nr:hypothetical protein [Gallionella sp.]
MNTAQNIAYSVVQVLHNFGAIATVGSALTAAKYHGMDFRNKLAWLALAGWGTQAASGAMFGMVSYYFYHRFPDISGVALAALQIKILCAICGMLLLATYLRVGMRWSECTRNAVWLLTSALAVAALIAAAFLRWFA